MKIVIFGLTVSSSWGNGHATLWRGLIRAMAKRGHHVVFFERDVAYYTATRDLVDLPGGELILYENWEENLPAAKQHLQDADVAIVTSYCPDGIASTELILSSRARIRCFYDLDTPVTLSRWKSGKEVDYIAPRGLRDFDIVLSYTGGKALVELRTVLGARRVAPLYGWVDPQVHRPASPKGAYRADLSYLGTYAEDCQAALQELFIDAARRLPSQRFLIGGAQSPQEIPLAENIYFVRHMPPSEHPAFFCSSRLTLNITRRSMADYGFCPSSRLFEAAACGAPILTDAWQGLEQFFEPGAEIIVAKNTQETVQALELGDRELKKLAEAARDRTLEEHTAQRRVLEFESALNLAPSSHARTRPRFELWSNANTGME